MPRHTTTSRFTVMEERMAALEASFVSLQSSFSDTLDAKLAICFEQFRREQALGGRNGGSTSDPDRRPALLMENLPDPPDGELIRTPRHEIYEGAHLHRPNFPHRIEFPRFTTSVDPIAWIYRAEQFFAYYGTAEHQKVVTVSFHLEGEALQWFRWMDCLVTTPRWDDFTTTFCREFGPSEFEDCTESLFKLRQTGTLKDYIAEFHRLANRTSDVGPLILKSCFLGGLKKELRFDMKLLRPATVHNGISITIQLDTKFSELKSGSQKFFPQHKPPLPPPAAPHRLPNLPLKKLSPDEIQKKREHGDCWFCDEKCVRGHRCGQNQLLMIDFLGTDEEIFKPPDVLAEIQHMELSECAYFGTLSKHTPQTMKVGGFINSQPVTFLLDSGSSHSFVDSRLVKKRWLEIVGH